VTPEPRAGTEEDRVTTPEQAPDPETQSTAGNGGVQAASSSSSDHPATSDHTEASNGQKAAASPGQSVNGEGASEETTASSSRARLRRWRNKIPRPVPPLIKLGIVALIVEFLVVPQIAGTRKALHLLGDVHFAWVILGVLLEIAALVAYAQLTRAVLPKEADPGLYTLLRIQMSTLSISHTVPGGTAAGSSLGYRLLSQAGVDGPSAGFALATQGLGSAVVLNVIFWLAVIISIPIWGFSAVYGIAALVGVFLVAVLVALVLIFTKGHPKMRTIIRKVEAHVPFVEPGELEGLFARLSVRLAEMRSQPRLLIRASAWAAANWLFDAASLYVFVGAFGHFPNPDGLLVAYGVANIVAVLPITPGGLGVVETVLSSTLVGYGTPRGIAILGVLTYRLVQFWLPIPLGGLTYLSLQVNPGAAGPEARRKLREQRRAAWSRFFDFAAGRGRNGDLDRDADSLPASDPKTEDHQQQPDHSS
jgi:uncharacterized protein (TIRG00374 family)